MPQFENGVSIRSEGRERQVISSDYEVTLKQLSECGAENVHDNRMSIEEIAVQILKEQENVASV